MYRHTGTRFLFLISVFICSMNSVYTQEEEALNLKERRELAAENIKKLEKGLLIVRLESQQKKIETFQELIGGGKLNEKTEKKIRSRLEGTMAKTESASKAIIKAFHEKYRFSDFLFMFDTASVSLKNGAQSGIFINKDLEVDPTLTLDNRPWFVLRFGATSADSGQSIEAMVIMDDTFEDLQSPFPYYTRINNFNSVMGGFFPNPKQEQRNADRMVENLHENLLQFSQRVE